MSTQERFWPKVNKAGQRMPHMSTNCWEWTAGRRYGYGVIGGKDGVFIAHRLSLEWHMGRPIGEGLLACHHCDNRSCVRPDHLYEGTYRDNFVDAAERGRCGVLSHPCRARGEEHWSKRQPEHYFATRARGERHWGARLTAAGVAEIRALAASGMLQREIAKAKGLTEQHVSDIVLRKRWKHVA